MLASPALFLSLLASGREPTNRAGPSPPPPTHLFVGGLGYCGARIAATFHGTYPGCAVSGTVRSPERRDALLADRPAWLTGAVHVIDLDDEYAGLDSAGVADLASASHVVQTVAPIADFDKDPLLALHGSDIRASSSLRYVGYLSSTGVYGDHEGAWVTEEGSELRCVDAKSRARIVAEKEWGALERDDGGSPRVDFFRCGGIYGPGRGPLFSTESLQPPEAQSPSGEDISGPPKYVNRILVDDICGALLAAASRGRPPSPGGAAFNLVDDHPAPRRRVVAEARRLRSSRGGAGGDGRREPGGAAGTAARATATKARQRVTRSTGNKRCRNARLKETYGWEPTAPSYKEGLALLLERSDLRQ